MTSLARLYGAGMSKQMMQSRFLDIRGHPKRKVAALIQQRHKPPEGRVGPDNVYRRRKHEWKVPLGLLYYWHRPLRRHQMVVLHPWFVVWRSPRTHKRLKKQFQSLPHAIDFVATRAQYVDTHAAVVAKHPYDVIPSLRGKLPLRRDGHTYYWCPLCVTAREFYRVNPEQTFWATKKTWSDEKRRYIWRDRKVRVLACRVCGCTNRNAVFRRSNQPWETRKFKQGARRARRKRA